MNWISAAEKMPPVGEWVIVSGKKASNFDPIVCEARVVGINHASTRGQYFRVVDITHWMPMPAAPEAEMPAEPAREWRVAWEFYCLPGDWKQCVQFTDSVRCGVAFDEQGARAFARSIKTETVFAAYRRNIRVQSRTPATDSQPAGEWQDEQ